MWRAAVVVPVVVLLSGCKGSRVAKRQEVEESAARLFRWKYEKVTRTLVLMDAMEGQPPRTVTYTDYVASPAPPLLPAEVEGQPAPVAQGAIEGPERCALGGPEQAASGLGPAVVDPTADVPLPWWTAHQLGYVVLLACKLQAWGEVGDCMPQVVANPGVRGYASYERKVIRVNWGDLLALAHRLHIDTSSLDFTAFYAAFLAHEYGHFVDRLMGRQLRLRLRRSVPALEGVSNVDHLGELWADYVAGCLMAHASSHADDLPMVVVRSAFRAISPMATATHPGAGLREAAVNAGWARCGGQPPGEPLLESP